MLYLNIQLHIWIGKKQVQLKDKIIYQAGLKLSLTKEKYVTVMQNCHSCSTT